MYRIVGILLIVISCGGFFLRRIQAISKKFDNLKEFKKGITNLKYELSSSGSELPLIFEKVSEMVKGDVSVLFKNMGKELAKNEISDMRSVWKKSGGEELLFSKEVYKVATELIFNIGRKEINTEIEKINSAIFMLEQIEIEEREKTQKDKKLLYTVGASLAVIVVILFI